MRQHFLLDENILFHAVRGVDEHNNPDETAAELIRSIAHVCHTLTIHRTLLNKYWEHLQKLWREPTPVVEPLYFINQFI